MSITTVEQAPGKTAPSGGRTPERKSWIARFFLTALHHIPTLLVLAALAGLGVAGHYSHWKIPKFSALVGAAPEKKADWCDEHGVPESSCVECNPALMPQEPDYGWCDAHGVSNCPLDHPDVAQLKAAPAVTDADLEQAARALALLDRQGNNSVCKNYQRRIQFASHEAVQQAGVEFWPVETKAISEWIEASGEIRYDPTRFASLASRAPGTVWRVEKNVGDRVAAGEVLALIDAMDVGRAKSELVQALAEEKLQRQNVERLKSAAGVVAGRQVLEAEALLAKARAAVISAEQSLINLGLPVDAQQLRELPETDVMNQLRFLGIPAAMRTGLDPRKTTANLLPLRAPIDGVIVDRGVVSGEVVDVSHVAFQMADTSRMWLILNVALEHADKLSLGQTVRFQGDGSRNEIEGALNWISTAADKTTRMVQVRAEFENPDGLLRDETFGEGKIVLREEPSAAVVPSQAVHWEGCCQVVFVRDKDYFEPGGPKLFHVRSVRVGVTVDSDAGKITEVIAGLLPGEVVATTGSDVLLAQLLKSSLGAGCCEIE